MLNKKLTMIKFALVACFALFMLTAILNTAVDAQTYDINNVVGKSHPWISEVNPAMVSFQYGQVSLGIRSFHIGFVPDNSFGINESHVSVSFPFLLPLELGLGADLRYYSAGIYSELNSSLLVSRKIASQLGVGLKIGLVRFGFSRDNFSEAHAIDPLLAGSLGKNGLNFGMGAFWNPGNWSIGIGVNHVNQPDMGYQTAAPLLREISAAVGYSFGYITPTVLLQNDGMNVHYGLAVSLQREGWGLVQLSFENTMPFKMEIQFSLSENNKLQYGLDLPRQNMAAVSMGSHEAIYTHIFDRGPDIGEPELLLSTPFMQIFEEKVVRSMPADLYPSQLEHIAELAPEYLKTDGAFRNLLIVPTGPLSPSETLKIRQERHVKLGIEIRNKLKQHPGLSLILQTEESSMEDARALKSYLQKNGIVSGDRVGVASLNSTGTVSLTGFYSGQENQSHSKPRCSHEHLSISPMVSGRVRQVKEWTLEIKNSHNKTIRTIRGTEKLPEQLLWDWKDNWGELVPAGEYTCDLSIKSLRGQAKSSPSKKVTVTRINRTVVLQFKQEKNLQVNKMAP